jgi:hypothetical protein
LAAWALLALMFATSGSAPAAETAGVSPGGERVYVANSGSQSLGD